MSCQYQSSFAVKEAVKHIGQAPFLQLQKGQLSSRHDASDRVLEDPQVGTF